MLVFKEVWSTTRGCRIQLIKDLELAAAAAMGEGTALEGRKRSAGEKRRERGCFVARYVKRVLGHWNVS